MLEFIGQNLSSILVGIAVSGLLAGAVITMVRDRKNRKSSCGGCCGSCRGCGMSRRD